MLRRVQLYLVRHAEAADGDPDELRPLTAEGRETARALGERLAKEGVQPDAVLTSPLLRARETGQELARPAGIEAEPDERLAPGATAAAVKAAAGERGDHRGRRRSPARLLTDRRGAHGRPGARVPAGRHGRDRPF